MTVAMVRVNQEPSGSVLTELSANIWGHFPRGDSIATFGDRVAYFEFEDFIDFPVNLTNTSSFAKGWNVFLSDGAGIIDSGVANA